MPVTLPLTPHPLAVRERLVTNAIELSSPFGGVTQRVARLGDRYAFEVTLPPMRFADALTWRAAFARCRTDTAVLRVRQPGLTLPGGITTGLVNGNGQAGSTLALRGLPNSAGTIPAGAYLSLAVGASRRLHMVTVAAIVGGTGTVTLNIAPALRESPIDGLTVQLSAPEVEGWLDMRALEWAFAERPVVDGLTFSLTEAR